MIGMYFVQYVWLDDGAACHFGWIPDWLDANSTLALLSNNDRAVQTVQYGVVSTREDIHSNVGLGPGI